MSVCSDVKPVCVLCWGGGCVISNKTIEETERGLEAAHSGVRVIPSSPTQQWDSMETNGAIYPGGLLQKKNSHQNHPKTV